MKQRFTAIRPCPVCEQTAGTELAKLSYALFDDLEIPGTKTLLQCEECGMLYDDVSFSEKQLQEYYRRNEYYAASSLGGTGSLSADNMARYDRIMGIMKPEKNSLILDVGCGQGGFVARCLEHGLNAAGVEPSEKSRAAALAAGLDVSESLEAFVAGHPGMKVHYVAVSHVLEHMLDPLKTLRKLSKYASGAEIYIEVPDAASYLAPGAVRWQEMYFEHICHFRRKNMVDIARRAGIRIIREGGNSFSDAQLDIRCCFLLGVFDAMAQAPESLVFADEPQIAPLPPVPGESVPSGAGSLALWGVSQFAMLMMGSRPELSKIDRLFDASPAKAGRKINGVIIETPDKISTLSEDTVLILPVSPYISQIKKTLVESTYKGSIIEV